MIEMESEPGNTRFNVRLPLDGSAKAESPAKPD
jgi:nitrogen-specific signal transduction histidine kinase